MKGDASAARGLRQNLQVLKYFFHLTHSISKSYIPVLACSSLVQAVKPFVAVLLPKFIIDELTGAQRPEAFALLVAVGVLLGGALTLLGSFLDKEVSVRNSQMKYAIDAHLAEKIMAADFQQIEDPEVLALRARAIWVFENHGGIWWLISALVNVVSKGAASAGFAVILATFQPLLLVAILGILLINMALNRAAQRWEVALWDINIEGNRGFNYYISTASDFSFAKDIRMFDAAELVMEKIQQFVDKMFGAFRSMFIVGARFNGVQQVNVQVQMLIAYAYLTLKVFQGAIGIGDFTLYAGAISQFSRGMSEMLHSLVDLRAILLRLGEFLELEQVLTVGDRSGKTVPSAQNLEIRFEHVSFRYPRSEDDALRDVSIAIQPGEKLSVVGLNGAGKTTFIKLLTRLYEPTEGRILLGGVDIREYDLAAYQRLMAVVFQDYKLLAFTAAENVSLSDQPDRPRVEEALELSGLAEKMRALPKGMDTHLYRLFEKDGVELSGGEGQKLAIARAIYKQGSVVVLDEPTAALDPIAEYAIFKHFDQMIGKKTTIYISHRLSSCRFCDRVAVFEGGRMVQLGTHEQLSQRPGLYQSMWEAQAQYYVDQAG